MLQFHFHSPSEHAIEGTPWDAELHLVHVVSSKPLGSEELHLAEVEFADRLSAVGLE